MKDERYIVGLTNLEYGNQSGSDEFEGLVVKTGVPFSLVRGQRVAEPRPRYLMIDGMMRKILPKNVKDG